MPADFTPIAKTDALADGQMKGYALGYEMVCLVRLDGRYYALEDFCAHAGGVLSSGVLDGEEMVCPLHGARFDVRTGKQSVGPSLADQPTYPVRIDGDDVLIGPLRPVGI